MDSQVTQLLAGVLSCVILKRVHVLAVGENKTNYPDPYKFYSMTNERSCASAVDQPNVSFGAIPISDSISATCLHGPSYF